MTDNQKSYAFSKKTGFLLLSLMLAGLLILFTSAPLENEATIAQYEYGNLALEIWGEEGRNASPLWVHIWVIFILFNGLTSIFFMRRHTEARWAGGGILFATIFFSLILLPILPILELGGMFAIMHFILWTPGLYLLLRNRPFLRGWSPYAVWSGTVTFTILFSYIFDVRDAAIYIPHIWNLHFGAGG